MLITTTWICFRARLSSFLPFLSSTIILLVGAMSLYADEDLVLPTETDLKPSTSSAIAGPSVPTDPLQALAAALSCPAESPQQADALLAAGRRFEEHPERLPELCVQLLPMVVEGGESLLRSWTLDMVALAVGRSSLNVEVKIGGESDRAGDAMKLR